MFINLSSYRYYCYYCTAPPFWQFRRRLFYLYHCLQACLIFDTIFPSAFQYFNAYPIATGTIACSCNVKVSRNVLIFVRKQYLSEIRIAEWGWGELYIVLKIYLKKSVSWKGQARIMYFVERAGRLPVRIENKNMLF